MHCFDAYGDTINKGIPLSIRESFQTGDSFLAVEVGEEGRGRTLHWVGLARGVDVTQDSPPRIENVGVFRTKKGRHLIVKDDGITDDQALVRLYFREGRRGTNEYEYLKGVTEITWGYFAQGLAGRMGGGYAVLLRLLPGATVLCFRTGELHGAPSRLYLHWDGKDLRFLSPEDYVAMIGGVATAE